MGKLCNVLFPQFFNSLVSLITGKLRNTEKRVFDTDLSGKRQLFYDNTSPKRSLVGAKG